MKSLLFFQSTKAEKILETKGKIQSPLKAVEKLLLILVGFELGLQTEEQ